MSTISSPDTVSLAYTYDGPQPLSETWSGNIAGHVDVTYDHDFRPATQSVNGASSINLAYDLDGLLATAGDVTLHRQSATGLLDSIAVDGVSTTQDYNGVNELQNLHYSWGTGTLTQSLARDAIGRIAHLTEKLGSDTSRTYDYVYTTAGRLKDVFRSGNLLEHYEYDANGNRKFASLWTGAGADTASSTIDAQDRLLRYKNTRYSYTANGELTQKVTGSDTTRYTYDELGNLVTVKLGSGTRIDYLIDGRNRRVGKKVNGAFKQGWLYQDGLRVVAELDSTGSVVARYVYGSRAHVPDYVVKGGVTYRLITDQLGSVRQVVKCSDGTVMESLAYDSWGRVVTDTSPGFVTLAYSGGLYDPGTGLVRFGARDYDASVGRWTSKDPIGFAGGEVNLITFADDDPVNRIDPVGTSAADDLNSIAGFWDTITFGATKRIRNRYFSYNSIDQCAESYGEGHREGVDAITQAAFGFGGPLLGRGFGLVAALTYDADQTALIELARSAERAGGVTLDEAKTLQEWAQELGVPFRGPEAHPGRDFGRFLHIRVGPVNHIPVSP